MIIAGGIIYYALTCTGGFCGFVVILPLMPWPLLAQVIPGPNILFDALDSAFGPLVLVLLNGIIIYFIGVLIERMVKKIKNRNNPLPLN